MDAKLAAAYGTAPVNETDLEALATAELATKLAASDELDVSGLSDEQAEALAAEVLGNGEGEAPAEEPEQEEPVAEEAPAEEPEVESVKTAAGDINVAKEKIAEADYLGRVMAHAYVNERTSIEKEAAAAKVAAEKTAGAKMDAAKKAGGKVAAHLKTNAKTYGAGAGAGAVGFMAGRKSKKASAEEKAVVEEPVSALDQLAQMRALDILKENGIDPNAPEEAAPEETEKKSSLNEEQQALLNDKVNERAHQLLIDNGYTFKDAEPTTEAQ